MKQLTIRGFDKQLEEAIRSLAKREEISLNKAAIRLLRRAVELEKDELEGEVVGSSLDHLAGTWSETDASLMEEVEKDFERIDPELWS